MLDAGLLTKYAKSDYGFAAHVKSGEAGTVLVKDGVTGCKQALSKVSLRLFDEDVRQGMLGGVKRSAKAALEMGRHSCLEPELREDPYAFRNTTTPSDVRSAVIAKLALSALTNASLSCTPNRPAIASEAIRGSPIRIG